MISTASAERRIYWDVCRYGPLLLPPCWNCSTGCWNHVRISGAPL